MDMRQPRPAKSEQKATVHLTENLRALTNRINDATLNFRTSDPALYFVVPGLPPTVNHMYKHCGGRKILTEQALKFRQDLFYCMGGQNRSFWHGVAVGAALIVLRSPIWVTKKGTIARRDADNRIKPLFDAIEHATEKEDQIIFEHHVFKQPAEKEETMVWLTQIV